MSCTRCSAGGQLRRGLCKNCWATNRLRFGWESSYVDAQPTRAHINMLIVAGLGTRRIAALSGVNRKAIMQVLHGRPDRGTPPSRRVLASTAARIQAVPLPLERHHLAADHMPVGSLGSTRRLQALVCIGYTQSYLAERLGITVSNARDLFHGTRAQVTAVRARAIDTLYLELRDQPPPESRGRTRSRTRAREAGWVDPFGWEDEDIDNPDATPEPVGEEHRPTLREQVAELQELGYTEHEIERRFGHAI